MAGIEDADFKEKKIDFWENVYGIDMSIIKNPVVSEPIIDSVNPISIVTDDFCVFSLNLKTIRPEQLNFSGFYKLKATRDDYVHGLIA